jgi:hypothetical protein
VPRFAWIGRFAIKEPGPEDQALSLIHAPAALNVARRDQSRLHGLRRLLLELGSVEVHRMTDARVLDEVSRKLRSGALRLVTREAMLATIFGRASGANSGLEAEPRGRESFRSGEAWEGQISTPAPSTSLPSIEPKDGDPWGPIYDEDNDSEISAEPAASRVPGLSAEEAERVLTQALEDLAALLPVRIAALDLWEQPIQKSFRRWFGRDDEVARKIVRDRLDKVKTKLATMTLENFCAGDEESGCFAYVDPDDDTKMYIGDEFRYAGRSGRDSKAGVIAHEISHYRSTGRTFDHEYGEERAEKLARDDPERALENADSFEYFVEG